MNDQGQDPIDALIDRIAEAVVKKIDEKEKIDAIAQAVLLKIDQGGLALKGETSSSSPNARRPAEKAARSTARRSKAKTKQKTSRGRAAKKAKGR